MATVPLDLPLRHESGCHGVATAHPDLASHLRIEVE